MLICGYVPSIKISDNSNTNTVTSHNPDRFLDYICDVLLPNLDSTMVGMNNAVEQPKGYKGKSAVFDVGNVAEELKTFGKECKYCW